MKHTVIIPLYNKEMYILDTIQSLAHQLQKADEMIIVDDFSEDNSLQNLKDALTIFASYFQNTKIQIVELKENKGPGNARNIGLELATGTLVSFLDADDCYTPSFILEVGELMQRERIDMMILGIQWTPSGLYLPDISSFKKELTTLTDEVFLIPNALHTASSPDFIMGVGSNLVVRKELITNTRYDCSIKLNEGIDFWYRVLKQLPEHARVALFNKPCIEVREVEGSLSRTSYANWKEIEVPLSIRRYIRSTNIFDQQLIGMLSQRWFEHAMERLPSWKQKVLFIVNHHKILLKSWYYFKRRHLSAKLM